MLNFEPFSISSLQKALPYIKKNTSLCSDLSAGYLFMWSDDADMKFCIWNDTFSVMQNVGEQPAFSFPMGADPEGMTDELKQYAYANDMPFRFFGIDEERLNLMRADSRLQPAMWAYDRKWSDYVYDFAEAMSFPGKKFSGQRNHINKFKKLYGEPEIRFLSKDDDESAEGLLKKYESEHTGTNALEKKELEKTRELYGVHEMLGLYAAGMFVDDELIALSIGEVMGEQLIIHVEKALKEYEGVYPTMYSGFVRLMADRLGHPLKYVNREDDSGDPGLRTSKQQYHPICMADKYLVHIDSPAVRFTSHPMAFGDGVVLTEFRETDREAYLRLNTDADNNRYWGYDYREDMSITGPVDENTFYDMTALDEQAGDSVNYAVRLSENGEMIGEMIFWNFTLKGNIELGCRLLPEYHGKGYGKAAFGAALELALRMSDNDVTAKCYLENLPSYRMITDNGFILYKKDAEYYYFAFPGTGRLMADEDIKKQVSVEAVAG
ncbi:MAG: GNAT family N-acetyltransferase [Lachnospiraceae bacterium]|nr:GNAT family N-acetyltransferase [Lachnospiraceae bacterium]